MKQQNFENLAFSLTIYLLGCWTFILPRFVPSQLWEIIEMLILLTVFAGIGFSVCLALTLDKKDGGENV